ncbi:hypothetical protein FE784_24155 [Paenibacillus hemerocallicola]|uniref:Uncharacterized protein n=1 Tax=Paenibacillus hemerocallicola TaxID=1172614 RepID=A0A5C4T5T7_9BACL|nr:hypothetical protein [Paenibacillus hemerocallicola]TNJ63687.1 hypothetical protein FE784_24155 [Paenibacillus hemerocallicola]
MKQEQRAAVHRGTIFRYYPNFRCMLEDNGTGLRYFDLSGRTWGANSGIAERFSFILQTRGELEAIAYSRSAMSDSSPASVGEGSQPFTDHAVHACFVRIWSTDRRAACSETPRIGSFERCRKFFA